MAKKRRTRKGKSRKHATSKSGRKYRKNKAGKWVAVRAHHRGGPSKRRRRRK